MNFYFVLLRPNWKISLFPTIDLLKFYHRKYFFEWNCFLYSFFIRLPYVNNRPNFNQNQHKSFLLEGNSSTIGITFLQASLLTGVLGSREDQKPQASKDVLQREMKANFKTLSSRSSRSFSIKEYWYEEPYFLQITKIWRVYLKILRTTGHKNSNLLVYGSFPDIWCRFKFVGEGREAQEGSKFYI
jgi:hypothetical protein